MSSISAIMLAQLREEVEREKNGEVHKSECVESEQKA